MTHYHLVDQDDPTPRPAARWTLLFFLYLGFVVYGSLMPFDFQPVPLAEMISRFLDIPYNRIGAAGRADWVANLILYVPLGFLWMAGWCTSRWDAGAWFAAPFVVLAIAAIAVAVEFVQLVAPPRTVSLNDLGAEVVGGTLGVGLWLAAGRPVGRLVEHVAAGGQAGLRAVLVLYCLGYLFVALFPYDFVASPAELSARLASDRLAPFIAESACVDASRCAAKLAVELAALVPLGVLWAMVATTRRTAVVVAGAAVAGAAIGIAIEGLQVFLVSGVSQGISVLTRALGMAAGAAAWRGARRGRLRLPRGVLRAAVVLGAAVLVVALARLQGLGAMRWTGWADVAARWDSVNLLPFYYHYYTTEQAALFSLLVHGAMFAPVGLGWFLWRTAGRVEAPRGGFAAGLLAAILALALEAGLLLTPDRRPDPTNLLIAFAAAAFTYVLCRWGWRQLGFAMAARDDG